MRVGIMAPPWKEIPPLGYGGIEDVVYSLIRGLNKLGVELVLYSIGKSARSPEIRQLGIPVGGIFKNGQYSHIHCPREKADIERKHAIEGWQWLAKQRVDIVLDHTGSPGFLEIVASSTLASALPKVSPPILHTLHGLPDGYNEVAGLPGVYFVSISEAQRAQFSFDCITNIHNGIRVEEFPFNPTKADYLLNIGRITSAKGQLEAIKVAQALGKTLVLAGFPEPTTEGKEYWKRLLLLITVNLAKERNKARKWKLFEEAIKGSAQIIFWGEADFEDKARLCRDALCFLMSILWSEPFGLVTIEAMACGTPVVAFRQGAVPEIIKHGETGFVVGNLTQMIAAVEVIGTISPQACRQRVERFFSDMRMARDYLGTCRSILVKERKPNSNGLTVAAN